MLSTPHLSPSLQRKMQDSLLTGEEAVAIISVLDSHTSTVLLHTLSCQNISLITIVQKLIAQSNLSIQLEMIENDQY